VSIVTDMSLGTANAVSMASKCERERERDKDDQKSIKDFLFLSLLSSRCREVSGHENVEQGKCDWTCTIG
jgi:hypothetical protein